MIFNHFKISEFACHCGCGNQIDYGFVSKLDALREEVRFPMTVTSGYRCPKYNAQVSETGLGGPHTTGHAADFSIRGSEAYRLVGAAMRRGFTGVGVSQKGDSRFIHLDDLPITVTSPRPRIWSY